LPWRSEKDAPAEKGLRKGQKEGELLSYHVTRGEAYNPDFATTKAKKGRSSNEKKTRDQIPTSQRGKKAGEVGLHYSKKQRLCQFKERGRKSHLGTEVIRANKASAKNKRKHR